MIVLHSTAVIAPELEARYVEFKARQAGVQLRTPGFVERMLLRDCVVPGTYYYLALYATAEANARVREDPEFAALTREYAVSILPIEQRQAMLARGEEPPSGLTQQLRLARCEIIVDARLDLDLTLDVDTAPSSTSPATTVLHATRYLEPAGIAPFEAAARLEAGTLRQHSTRVGRLLLRDVSVPGGYFDLSWWRGAAPDDGHACEILQAERRST